MDYADEKYINPVNFDVLRYITTEVNGIQPPDFDPYIDLTPRNSAQKISIPNGSELLFEKLRVANDRETTAAEGPVAVDSVAVLKSKDYNRYQLTTQIVMKRIYFVQFEDS